MEAPDASHALTPAVDRTRRRPSPVSSSRPSRRAIPDSTTAGSRSASERPTASNIFSIRPDGTGQKQLTKGPGYHFCPSFSADGRTIAYCSNVSGAWEIWTMKANGSKQRQLTHLDGFATFPDFSPDGKTIVFGGTENGAENTTIYTVDAKTGGGLHALTSCVGFDPDCFSDLPVWSPDGTRIAFVHGVYDPIADEVVDESNWHFFFFCRVQRIAPDSPTWSSRRLMRFPSTGRFLIANGSSMFFCRLRQGSRLASWNIIPISCGRGPLTLVPSSRIWPRLRAWSPDIDQSRVVLPHPLGPRTVTNSPSATSSENDSSAWTGPVFVS